MATNIINLIYLFSYKVKAFYMEKNEMKRKIPAKLLQVHASRATFLGRDDILPPFSVNVPLNPYFLLKHLLKLLVFVLL